MCGLAGLRGFRACGRAVELLFVMAFAPQLVFAATPGYSLQRVAIFVLRVSLVRGEKRERQANNGKTNIALVAQLVEHGTFNAGVLGSSPNERTP